jgi:hypothetical protein
MACFEFELLEKCSFLPKFQYNCEKSTTHSSKVNYTLVQVNYTFCVRKHTLSGPALNFSKAHKISEIGGQSQLFWPAQLTINASILEVPEKHHSELNTGN